MPKSERAASIIRDYAIAVGAVLLASGLGWLLQHAFGARFPFVSIIFLFAIGVSAWRGYGPGALAALLSVYTIGFLLRPHFAVSSQDATSLAQGLVISLLVSTIARSQRRAQTRLQQGQDELEARVLARTTELETVNASLLQAERRLHDVLNSVSESFLALDREWRLTFVNRRIADSLKMQPEQVVGKVLWDLFPAARNTRFYTEYKRVMDERVSVHFEMFYEPNGTWLEVTAHPTPEGLSAYVVDATERKHYEVNLARLAAIVETSSDAMVSKSLEGVILTWNSAAERIYGYTAAEVIGARMEIIVPPEKLPEEHAILDQLRRGERIEHFVTTRLRKDGSIIDVSLTISPLHDAEGGVVGASHVARDITEQKNFERQIHQVQKLESLGVLAGGVAHDFNNLLVGIVGNASLALEDAPPQSRGSLQDVISAGERAADLTRQLLAYAGKGKVHTRPLNMSSLVRDISALVRTSMSRSVHLNLDLAEPLPPIMADSGQMQQIVMNLVINAAEAIGDSKPGTVAVTTGAVNADEKYLSHSFGVDDLKAGHYVTLEVQDTGCGMDEATVARIFDPFFTTKFLGRGLGLSAVLGIVRAHGGALKVYSAPGRGTTFRALFPAAAGHVEEALPVETAEDLSGAGTVLVVDDDDTVRKVARNALERRGYRVVEAMNGEIALDVLRASSPAVLAVLLDLTMPVMGGEETLRHISIAYPMLPVILSSGFNESEAMQRFAGKGVAAFLQKPYTALGLARVLRRVAPSTPLSASNRLTGASHDATAAGPS